MRPTKPAPEKSQKRRQYPTLTEEEIRALGHEKSKSNAIPHHYDDQEYPEPEAPPELAKAWYQSEPIVKTSKVINGAACVLGILYAALAFQEISNNLTVSISYGVSSFIMNVPLSWFFTIKLIDMSIRVKKKEPLYIAAYVLALFLAIGTTAAGIQLAKESAENFEKLPNFLRVIPSILFLFNRFCTRFTGSLNVLYVIFKFSIDEYYKRFSKNRIYYELLYDIKHYSQGNGVPQIRRSSEAINLKVFANAFYENMPNLTPSQNPGETSGHLRNKILIKTASLLIISIFIINMQPLWLKLSTEGIQFLNPLKSWGKNTVIVWFAALSNELFYLYMAAIFLPSIAFIVKISTPKIKTKLNNANPVKKIAILTTVAFATIIWGLSAYYSGSDYNKDASDAMKNGFGNIADQTWFSWFAGSWTQLFMPVYDYMIAATSGGLIVNGGSTLMFLMEYVSFFKPVKLKKDYSKFDADDATRILEVYIGKHDFPKLEERPGEDIRDTIKSKRNAAQPHRGIWSSLFCCPRREPASDTIPFNRRVIGSYAAEASC